MFILITQKNLKLHKMADMRTTTLLTEHLGYAPIAVVDDVINTVNEIMYKCTQAVEDYLSEREQLMIQELNNKKILNEDDDVVMEGDESTKFEIPSDEIELGTAKLESLLESSVDKNFDLFELYTLRNILTIPQHLVDEGWFRLEHHKDLPVIKLKEATELDHRLETLQNEIDAQVSLNKYLTLQKSKIQKVNKYLNLYSKMLTFLKENPNYEKVKPMRENIHFIIEQLKVLFNDILKIKMMLIDDDKLIKQFKEKINSNDRDKYINSKSMKLLQSLGF